jgi:hypothetical protein
MQNRNMNLLDRAENWHSQQSESVQLVVKIIWWLLPCLPLSLLALVFNKIRRIFNPKVAEHRYMEMWWEIRKEF